jgi:lipopolysaccharide export system permease protein
VKILNKYVLKEHAGPLTFAAAALTSLLLLNYIAKNIGQLVGKGLPWTVIAEFIGLSVPFTVAMTLPMAVLVAVLYAFSRLAAENEITALKASGVSLSRVLIPVVIGATFITIGMVLFNDQVLPRSNHRLRTLQGDIARKKPTFALRARVLNEVSPGKLFLIANHLDPGTSHMREVVIYDLGDPTKQRTIYADSGIMAMVPETGDLLMTLYDGNMQEIKKVTPSELQRVFYKQDVIRVRGVGDQLTRSEHDDYKSEREMTICEMQENVADGARSQHLGETNARDVLLAGVRAAVTGNAPPPILPPRAPHSPTTYRAPLGLGRMYCDGEAAFLAFVARHRPPPPPPAPAIHPMGDTARAIAVTAKPAPPPPPPAHQGTWSAIPKPHVAPPPRPTPRPVLAHKPPPLPIRVATIPPPVLPPQVRYLPASPAMMTLTSLTGSVEAASLREQEGQRNIDLYDVEIQKKFAIAVACVIFVFLGAPIALRFPRGGVGMVLGVSLGVFALYYVGLIAGEPLGQRHTVSPWLAMWSSNIVFSIVGALLMLRIGRESSTSRGGDLGELLDKLRRRLRAFARTHDLPLLGRTRSA